MPPLRAVKALRGKGPSALDVNSSRNKGKATKGLRGKIVSARP